MHSFTSRVDRPSHLHPSSPNRLLVLAFVAAGLFTSMAGAQEAQWIWSPEHEKDQVPHVTCHFRRTINVRGPKQGQVSIVADDSYDLYVNGRRVGSGASVERFRDHNISRFLGNGRNIIGIRVTNTRGSTAGVAARVLVKGGDDEWETFSTDENWKTNLRPLPLWNTAIYNDSRWAAAVELGQLGETAPWDVREEVPVVEGSPHTDRFKVSADFSVEQLVADDQCGSLIAMTFNEFGHLVAAREGGPLLLVVDENEDGQLDTVREYCKKVKNCQGILALNGSIYVTADGPEGAALYRLEDLDQDGNLESVKALIRFGKEMGEHGAHGLALGPDGLIYLVAGNQATSDLDFDAASPHRNPYEGDLLRPRYEDPGGQANGEKVPGGVVLRTDLDGTSVELFAGGLRNAYDLSFNRHGELFVHDSDMESDIGTAWYRPNRLYHVVPGAELGWRSGWAKFPDYFVDTLPGILDTGRGSPTGSVTYNHFAFPAKYHGALFLGDWSEGRILAVKMKPTGASYSATSEVFLEGRPLNVTDLAVGPDGALYFSTGGRGTEGGIYRVGWNGEIPPAVANLGEGMSRAIRHPQMEAAWSRQEIAQIQNSLSDAWGKQLRGVARSTANPWYYRIRALDLMQLFGPSPTPELLIRLSKDGNEVVRAKAVGLMGRHTNDQTHYRLLALLEDPDRTVRRRACEALVQAGQVASLEALTKVLTSDDRHEAWAARRLLEQAPVDEWRDEALTSDQHRVFVQGGLALLTAYPSREHATAVVSRFHEFLEEFITDRDFVDMLRLAQVALHRGEIAPDEVPELGDVLGEEFPSSDDRMNRELIRLLAFLQSDTPMDRYFEFLESDAAAVEKLHLAMHLRFLEHGWSADRRIQLLEFFESAKQKEGGGSFERYIGNIERDFGKGMPLEEGLAVLSAGAKWPDAAIGVLYRLPAELDEETVNALRDLDRSLGPHAGDEHATHQLQAGIVAVLARSGDPESVEYLRQIWDTEPERREIAAIGLAQQAEDNWAYLVRSLPILVGRDARDVIGTLRDVDLAPQDPEPYRQVILQGLRLQSKGAEEAVALLVHWTGREVAGDGWQKSLAAWQRWFSSEYPGEPAPRLPVAAESTKWKFDELMAHLGSENGSTGSPRLGESVFRKVQCDKCHRYGSDGESLGPDLTAISKRFMRKELLEAILYPSHVIPDQYRSKSVVTASGRTYTGLIAEEASGEIVILERNGEKQRVPGSEVEDVVENHESAMPEGLLDSLSLEEISDLFAYLGMLKPASVAVRPDGRSAR
jgi:putative heme-binding domain-containing protein